MNESTGSAIKRKLSFDEMIEHLDNKNVKFDLISKDEAKTFLQESNYFYKITAYRKNFEKNKYDRYVNLDFKFLQDLSTIDMRLRYLVLHMSLDIEHAVKTQILTDITNDDTEDGYGVVSDFLAYDRKTIDDYMVALKHETHYNYGLYVKHYKNPPIWVLFEVMTFGAFVKFVEFYYERTGNNPKYEELQKTLKYVKNIRNTAAHNSPLLMDITERDQIPAKKIIKPITTFMKQIQGLSTQARNKRLTNRKTHDLTVLIYIHYAYIESEGIKRARYKELSKLLERSRRFGTDYEKSQPALAAVYRYFYKIIDFIQ